jgi:hypothetical protein
MLLLNRLSCAFFYHQAADFTTARRLPSLALRVAKAMEKIRRFFHSFERKK